MTWTNLEGFLVGMVPNFKPALQPTGIQLHAEDRDPGNLWTVLAEMFQIIHRKTRHIPERLFNPNSSSLAKFNTTAKSITTAAVWMQQPQEWYPLSVPAPPGPHPLRLCHEHRLSPIT